VIDCTALLWVENPQLDVHHHPHHALREKLRGDGRLTNCDTGDRLVISKPLPHPLPRSLQIGKYWGRIFHPGQVETDNQSRENNKNCHKCLKPGHFMLAVISGKRDIFDFNADGIRSKSLRIPRILCVKGYPPAT
jgi:hypothetical protein